MKVRVSIDGVDYLEVEINDDLMDAACANDLGRSRALRQAEFVGNEILPYLDALFYTRARRRQK